MLDIKIIRENPELVKKGIANKNEKIDNIDVNHKIGNLSWFNELKDNVETTKDENGVYNGNILVYIHGYNNNQDKLLKRHRQLKKSLQKNGFNGVVVSFDWPSEGNPLEYYNDRDDAKNTALNFITDGFGRGS